MAKKVSVSDRLKELRDRKGVTVIEVANATNIHRMTLYRIERIGGKPHMATLAELARYFGCTIGQVRGTEGL